MKRLNKGRMLAQSKKRQPPASDKGKRKGRLFRGRRLVEMR